MKQQKSKKWKCKPCGNISVNFITLWESEKNVQENNNLRKAQFGYICSIWNCTAHVLCVRFCSLDACLYLKSYFSAYIMKSHCCSACLSNNIKNYKANLKQVSKVYCNVMLTQNHLDVLIFCVLPPLQCFLSSCSRFRRPAGWCPALGQSAARRESPSSSCLSTWSAGISRSLESTSPASQKKVKLQFTKLSTDKYITIIYLNFIIHLKTFREINIYDSK